MVVKLKSILLSIKMLELIKGNNEKYLPTHYLKKMKDERIRILLLTCKLNCTLCTFKQGTCVPFNPLSQASANLKSML